MRSRRSATGSCSPRDGELEAGHVPGLIGGEEQHRVADIARLDGVDSQRVHEDRTEVRVPGQQRVQRAKAGAHRGVHAGRVDGIAELSDALVDDLPDGGGVPDVGLPGDDLPAERRHGRDRVREILLGAHAVADRLVVLEDVDGDDVRTLFGQPDRVTAALAAGGAGDEGDLACYSSYHGVRCPSPPGELHRAALGMVFIGAMHGTRPRRLPRCVCGHDRQAHRHYRSGSDCALCSCPRWRRPLFWWFRRGGAAS